jgi:hypothetical protein
MGNQFDNSRHRHWHTTDANKKHHFEAKFEQFEKIDLAKAREEYFRTVKAQNHRRFEMVSEKH